MSIGPQGLRTYESFHIAIEPNNAHANMEVAAKHGTAFLINTGYTCYFTRKLYPDRYCVVFDDQHGERRVLSYEVILNITVGMGDNCVVGEFTPHEK